MKGKVLSVKSHRGNRPLTIFPEKMGLRSVTINVNFLRTFYVPKLVSSIRDYHLEVQRVVPVLPR